MTQLKVTCPACGHVRVDAVDVRIVQSERGSYYVFACPDCSRRVKRGVTEDVADELVARGVPAVRSIGV